MTQQRFAFEGTSDPATQVTGGLKAPSRGSGREDRPMTVPDPQTSWNSSPDVLVRSAVFVRNARARRYVVRVRPDGLVRVTIPSRGSKRRAIEFIAKQQAWITAQRERLARERTESHDVMPPEEVIALRMRAQRELPLRLLELAAEWGLTVSRITIRSQRWRWGSCSRRGHISLNWRLVTMPDWIRDYVLLHELMHLKRMDHSPKFWAHVAKACPNYKAAQAWLAAFNTFPRSG